MPDTAAHAVAFTIKVTDSANQSSTQPYTVSIVAEPDTLSLSPASLSFGKQLVGIPSGTQDETLTNTGSSPVVVNSVASTGTNAGDFSQSNTCSTLAGGASCTIHVSFTPGQLGPRTAAITITDDTLGSPHSLDLSGAGVTSGLNATLSADSLTFGSEAVGSTAGRPKLKVDSLGSPDECVQEAWDNEVARRIEDLKAGKAVTVPWEQLHRELLAIVNGR